MTQTASPIRKTDRRNYMRFLVTRILNKCPWRSQEQQQKVKDQCLDKKLGQVNQIIDKVLETSSPDEQQKHRHRVNLLRCLHKSEFPVYSKQSKSPKKWSIMCSFQGHSAESAQHSTWRQHNEYSEVLNTYTKDELTQQPIVVVQSVEDSTGDMPVVKVVAATALTVDYRTLDVNSDVTFRQVSTTKSSTSLLAAKYMAKNVAIIIFSSIFLVK